MSSETDATIRFRRGSISSLNDPNIVPKSGEPYYEQGVGFKVGDGKRSYPDLPMYVDQEVVQRMIDETILEGGPGGGGNILADLTDDGHPEGIVAGQSLELIYQNGKV